ncbi:MAG: hypothetical protein L0Y32_00895 [Nevskiales bacterium]|nr:hypothetical protein [Nevskiales bacterium]
MNRKKPSRFVALALAAVTLPVTSVHAGNYQPGSGQLAVVAEDHTWADKTRGLQIPVRVFAPTLKAGMGPFPLVVISHGGGESRHSYEYLGQYWARNGYLVVVANHQDSDDVIYRQVVEKENKMPTRLENYVQRSETIQFLLNRLLSGKLHDPLLKGRIDPERVSVSGQCAGSTTALHTVGLTIPPAEKTKVAFPDERHDERVKAVVALGPQPVWLWDKIQQNIPILFVTATHDFNWAPPVKSDPRIIRRPYDRSPGIHKYLVELSGAQHFAFTDSAAPGYSAFLPVKDRDPRHHECIQQATTAFLDAYLKGNTAALEWLQSEKLEEASQELCKQEHR